MAFLGGEFLPGYWGGELRVGKFVGENDTVYNADMQMEIRILMWDWGSVHLGMGGGQGLLMEKQSGPIIFDPATTNYYFWSQLVWSCTHSCSLNFEFVHNCVHLVDRYAWVAQGIFNRLRFFGDFFSVYKWGWLQGELGVGFYPHPEGMPYINFNEEYAYDMWGEVRTQRKWHNIAVEGYGRGYWLWGVGGEGYPDIWLGVFFLFCGRGAELFISAEYCVLSREPMAAPSGMAKFSIGAKK